ncbi:hypothetical protein TIFTF001_009993 [Ficus carica]|uniref:Uncharacterized protein n=1 Tax=Ficus carica TaxID=3494 RepID=A0AA87ZP74_FICCA|nr:hypothetical protein TIFTF001_009993 [Ficus carica]
MEPPQKNNPPLKQDTTGPAKEGRSVGDVGGRRLLAEEGSPASFLCREIRMSSSPVVASIAHPYRSAEGRGSGEPVTSPAKEGSSEVAESPAFGLRRSHPTPASTPTSAAHSPIPQSPTSFSDLPSARRPYGHDDPTHRRDPTHTRV